VISLADLLCRRLISTSNAPGKRYDIGYGTAGDIAIVNETEVVPLATAALRGGSEIKAS
jgi:hypothetical protein